MSSLTYSSTDRSFSRFFSFKGGSLILFTGHVDQSNVSKEVNINQNSIQICLKLSYQAHEFVVRDEENNPFDSLALAYRIDLRNPKVNIPFRDWFRAAGATIEAKAFVKN